MRSSGKAFVEVVETRAVVKPAAAKHARVLGAGEADAITVVETSDSEVVHDHLEDAFGTGRCRAKRLSRTSERRLVPNGLEPFSSRSRTRSLYDRQLRGAPDSA